MTNFALYHCGRWKAGQNEQWETAIYTVKYDGETNAYAVPYTDFNSFQSWVAMAWEPDNEWQKDDEPDADYLERIGVQICKVFPQ